MLIILVAESASMQNLVIYKVALSDLHISRGDLSRCICLSFFFLNRLQPILGFCHKLMQERLLKRQDSLALSRSPSACKSSTPNNNLRRRQSKLLRFHLVIILFYNTACLKNKCNFNVLLCFRFHFAQKWQNTSRLSAYGTKFSLFK